MAGKEVPLIPDKPWECPSGHRWGRGRVLVGWETCTCPAGAANFNGHNTMRCAVRICRWRFYHPACGGREWIEA